MLRILTLGIGLLCAGATCAAEQLFELTIVKGSVPASQRVIRVDKGANVKLRVSSDSAGSLHLHAYKLEVPFTPGGLVEVAFTAHATGRFRFEWHADDPRAKPGDHHGPPLATLEVRPK